MVRRKGSRGEFWGYSKFPECKGTRSFTPLNVPDDYLIKPKPTPEPSTHLALDERAVLTRIVKFRLKDGRTVIEILNEDLKTKVTRILGDEL